MSRPNTNETNLKGNVREVRKNPKYEATTADIASYIQNDLNKISKAMRNQGIECDDIKISVTTQPLSKYFVMAALIMPASVLVGAKGLDNTPSVFRGSNEGNGVIIKNTIWEYIKNYTYTPEDRKMFSNPNWRSQVKFKSTQQINALNGFIRPTIIYSNGKYVVVAIDLIKVFKEMLKSNEPNVRERFTVWIDEFDEIENGTHKFILTKSYSSKGKDENKIDDIVRRNIAKAIAPVYRTRD